MPISPDNRSIINLSAPASMEQAFAKVVDWLAPLVLDWLAPGTTQNAKS